MDNKTAPDTSWMPMISMIMSATALGLAAIIWWNQLRQPVIVTVDLAGLVEDARNHLHGKTDTAQFAQQLQRQLRLMARDNHWVILAGRAVADGAPDITPALKRKLFPAPNAVVSGTRNSSP